MVRTLILHKFLLEKAHTENIVHCNMSTYNKPMPQYA
jgi:hypothetical protein